MALFLYIGGEPGRLDNDTPETAGSGDPVGAFPDIETGAVTVYMTSDFSGSVESRDALGGNGPDPADHVNFNVGMNTLKLEIGVELDVGQSEDRLFETAGTVGGLSSVVASFDGLFGTLVGVELRWGYYAATAEYTDALWAIAEGSDAALAAAQSFQKDGWDNISDTLAYGFLLQSFNDTVALFDRLSEGGYSGGTTSALERSYLADVRALRSGVVNYDGHWSLDALRAALLDSIDVLEALAEPWFTPAVEALGGSAEWSGGDLEVIGAVTVHDGGVARAAITGDHLRMVGGIGSIEAAAVDYGLGLATASYLMPGLRRVGSADDDRMIGGSGNDTLIGRGGNDRIEGRGGDDLLRGDEGHDSLYGGSGSDTLQGGDGNDLAYGGPGDDRLLGEGGHDTLYGDAGADTLFGGGGRDVLFGGNGDDLLFGGGGDDSLVGGADNDRIEGAGGHDELIGSNGDDSLYGGAGSDRLVGGNGRDLLRGGADADRFVFASVADAPRSAPDRILDFERGLDQIVLAGIDASPAAGNGAFRWIGQNDFTPGVAGRLRMEKIDAGIRVEADVDGDGRADFALIVLGPNGLAASDFIL